MVHAGRVAGATLLTIAAAAAGVRAGDPPEPRARVTIRGTGNRVSIERSGAPVPESNAIDARSSRGPLAEAIRMKLAGAEDPEVISFVQAHSGALPSIIEFAEVRALRDAGAGRTVMAYLESVAAVEIGPTAEPTERYTEPAPGPDESSDFDAPYGIPVGEGFAAIGGANPLRAHRQLRLSGPAGSGIRRVPSTMRRMFVAPSGSRRERFPIR